MAAKKKFVTPNEMHEFQRFGDMALMPDPEEIAHRAYLIGLREAGGDYYTKDEIDEMMLTKVSRRDVDPLLDDLPDNYQIEDLKRRQDALIKLMRYGHL